MLKDADCHSQVGEALALLVDGLGPFIEVVFAETVAAGLPWTDVIRRKDALAGHRDREYSARDLSLMLRAMTERLGELGYPFDRRLSRQGQNYASELREVRNQWAHNQEFTAQAAYRALDSAELLLREVGGASQAEEIATAKAGLLPTAPTVPVAADPTTAAPSSGSELAPAAGPRAAPGAAVISLSALDVVSYAMAHCRVAVVDEIAVRRTGPSLRGASVEVEVTCASGSLGGPKVLLLDLGEDQTTVLRNVELALDPAQMLLVDEQQPGQIRATLRDDAGEILANQVVDVTVLAASQWMSRPLQLGMEMLAAHVQPNAVAIAPLLVEASDRLQALTGNSSLNGYQSGDTARVDAIAQSIYEALQARDIRYAQPPASWGAGQKVRTPSEVVEGRLGTCLDTTVTMAAALEQAGIAATLWLLDGHIFLGYWREEDRYLPAVTWTDVTEVVNLVDLGQIGVVETTALTGGPDSAPFTIAQHAARSRLAGDLSEFLGITDIHRAREAQIFPLPSRAVGADGAAVVSLYEPGAGPVIAPYVGTVTVPAADEGSGVPTRVGRWKNALLDLSLRNRLINFTDRSGYRLEVPGSALARFEDQVNANAAIVLRASDEVGHVDAARGVRFGRDLPDVQREVLLAEDRVAFIDITQAAYKNKLRYLAYKAKTIVQETGSNNLYLAFGTLNWRFNDRDLRSPLVLVPVSLSTANRGDVYRLTIDEAGASTPNYCLLEKLRVEFGLEVPGLQNPAEDASGIDLAAAFRAMRTAIAEKGLALRVEETVSLAILQFAKFPLWKDLDEHWADFAENSLVRHLVHTPLETFVDPAPDATTTDLDELGALVPAAADSSQLEAVAEAVAGRTFVLEGPPGTGKSQTITNLLARALASGKRVLFVAEKRAALDVVKKRLEEAGLGHLSLDLHDKSARPAEVRAQIRGALDFAIRADADALQANAESARSARNRLASYATRLHELNAAGHSLYSAHAFDLAADPDVAPMDVPASVVAAATREQLDDARKALRELPERADLARPRSSHPWRFVEEPAGVQVDVAALHRAARELDAALAAVLGQGIPIDVLSHLSAPAELQEWAAVAKAPRFPIEAIDTLNAPAWRVFLSTTRDGADAFARAGGAWRSIVDPRVLDRDMTAISAAAVAADTSGIFGRRKRRRAVLAQIEDALLVAPETVNLKSLSQLTAELAAAGAQAESLRAAVARVPLTLVDGPWSPAVPEDADRLRNRVNWILWLGGALNPDGSPIRESVREHYASTAAGSGPEELDSLARAWEAFLTVAPTSPVAMRKWAGERAFLTEWWRGRAERHVESAVTLERWIDFVRQLEPLRRLGLTDARDALLDGGAPADDAVAAFDRGVALASIVEREEATGLGEFDSSAQGRTVDRFTSATSSLRAELPRAIPEDVLRLRHFNASSAAGQVGGLRRQLDRRRGGMTVRALVRNFGDLITQILPCTLMSPDSVARFFPAEAGLFDIVVFDEASQIRVADAVGAMGRGKAVVIVGDSRQMPPTQFGESSVAPEEDDDYWVEDVTDEESILSECVQARVPSKWLSWHYRSQDESLIAFSNFRYYENRLSSFPAPLPADTRRHPDGYGVSLVHVNGTFERAGRGRALRTNKVEADAIVADIQRRFWASADVVPSLGVVTFNAQQRDLIENLLRDCGDDRIVHALDEADGLFVKNLENVQGDERDCILFSVAFSANEKGVVPLNFGPLSKPGGERRLNVAATRARRQVVLYSSFLPEELRAEETTQVGTKHLKEYLQMADRGVGVFDEDGRRQSVVDRHRDELAAELRMAGYAVRTDIGLSDFRVDISIADASQPDKPLVAVLLDGPEWRARRTVADRDGLPVEVLKGIMRWPGVERVWLPEWLHNREQVLARLGLAVDTARTNALKPVTKDTAEPPQLRPGAGTMSTRRTEGLVPVRAATVAPPTAPVQVRRHPLVAEFREWGSRVHGDVSVLNDLPAAYARTRVRAAITSAIEVEGPIHPDRLASLVGRAFGLGRVHEDRKNAIRREVPTEHRPKSGEGFYWPSGIDPSTWNLVRVPTPGDSRPLDEVPLIEIANAMSVAADESSGLNAEDLKREALHLFGGQRMTEPIGKRLEAALKVALSRGAVELGPGGIHLSGRR